MFALGIRYLNGWVAATQVTNRDQVEWPPHPRRVFMAMAAAYFQEGDSEEERKALEWLESLDAPEVFASDCKERPTVTSYVPVNPRLEDEKKNKKRPPPPLQSAPGITRTRQPRTFARAWLEDENVFLVWLDNNVAPEIAESIAKICGRVTRIGHSSSFVQVRVVEQPEWENQSAKLQKWIPNDAQAERQFRVLGEGTLAYLRKQYNGDAVKEYGQLKIEVEHASNKKQQKRAKAKLKGKYNNQPPFSMHPKPSGWQGYALERGKSAVSAPGTVFDEKKLIILRLRRDSGDYRALGVVSTLRVTSALQKALIKTAADRNNLPEEISGHKVDRSPSERPHLAILPLAYVGSEHADGRLMGLALSLPRECSADIRRILLECLAKMRNGTTDLSPQLKLGALGVWNLDGITEDRPPFNLLASSWTASPQGTTEWGTVTPIVLDRHPKAKRLAEYRAEVAKTIQTACERVLDPKTTEKEMPKIVHVTLLPVSPHLGAPPAHSFPKMERKSGGQCSHTHALIVFDKQIVGPLLVGAGRYRGYGLCRPIKER